MSIKEIEEVWSHQHSSKQTSWKEIRDWIARHRRSSRLAELGFAIVTALTGLNLGTKIGSLLFDAEITLSTSGFDLLIALFSAVCVSISVLHARSRLRETEALGNDVARCLEWLIRETKTEIWQFKQLLPSLFAVIIVLFMLAKLQSVSAGRENFSNAMGGLILTVTIFVVIGAALYHRYAQFLLPRLAHLNKLQDSLRVDDQREA